MTPLLSLLAIVALLSLHKVCRRQRIAAPPLRTPLIAAVAIPLLTLIADIVGVGGFAVLQQTLAASITLLWAISITRLMSWATLEVPAELGLWKPTAKILRDLITLTIITTITLVVIHRDFQVNLVGLAATSAVVTAVLGLAAQETLKNLFAGISLQVDSPFDEGDWIDLGFTRGVVTSVRLMTTRIRVMDGSITVVPNSRITTEGLRRFKPNEPAGQTIDLGLDYSLPPRQAIQLLQRTLERNRKVLNHPTPHVWVSAFAESAITYRMLTWQKSALELQSLKSDLLEQIWYALHRIDQTIPFPVCDIRTKPKPTKLPSVGIDIAFKQHLLASTDIFSQLSEQQLKTLAEAAHCQSFAPGEAVVQQGERGDSLFIVVSGNLEVFQAETTGHASHAPEQKIASLKTTDIFGEMSLCTGEARSASVICINECVLIEIERRHLLPLINEQPDVLDTMGTILASRRQQLTTLEHNRTETRRLALIARMQRLFSLSSKES